MPEKNQTTKIMDVETEAKSANSPGVDNISNHNGSRRNDTKKLIVVSSKSSTVIDVGTTGGRKTSRSPGSTDWRLNIEGVTPKWEYLLENKLFTDVTFLVGPSQEACKCHSLVLKMQSRHFEQMLTPDKHEFLIPDCSPSVFHKMLRYLYTEKLEFSVDDAMDALVTAKQFHLTTLQAKCGRLVLEGINHSNAAVLLKKAEDMGDKQLSIKVQEYILQHANQVAFTPAFKEISLASLLKLLQADRALWKISEVRILDAVKLWASAECVRQSLDASGPNLYTVAKTALERIHFTSFTPMQFTSEVVKPKLLPSDKMLEIQSELIEREDITKSVYSGSVTSELNEDESMDSRSEEQASTPTSENSVDNTFAPDTLVTSEDNDQINNGTVYTLARYSTTNSKNCLFENEDGTYKITLSVSKPINVVGVVLYGHANGANALVNTCIKFTSYDEQSVHLEFEAISELPENGGEFDVILPQPFTMNKSDYYTVMITVNGRVCPSGVGGKRSYTIETNDGESVTFNFRNSRNVIGTTHVRGQLPKILFSMPASIFQNEPSIPTLASATNTK